MGLSSKQVSGEGLGWANNLMQAGAQELPNILHTKLQQQQQQQQPAPPPVKCPRCESTCTKFCYYNNYNRSQPRHFCKSCRRHWTNGGTLRNVPVGGGRKNKRLKTSNSTATNKDNDKSSHEGKLIHGVNQSQQFDDQKKFSELLHQSLLQPTSSLLPSSQLDYINNSLLGSTLSLDSLLPLPNLPSTTFGSFTSSSSFDARYQFPNVVNHFGEAKLTEELAAAATTTTTIATIMTPMPVQWQVLSTNSAMDSSSYWNWEDLNTFISTDAKQPWDDSLEK